MTMRFYAILAGREKALEAFHKPADTGGEGEAASAWDG
jgi:hypothetical protein